MKITTQHQQKFANFLKLIQAAKDKKVDVIVIDHPEVLGDDYDELRTNLELIAESEMQLHIVPPKDRKRH